MDFGDEILSSVGAQDLDTSGYQVCDLEDIDFHWEDLDLNMDSVSQPSKNTLFLLQILTISR